MKTAVIFHRLGPYHFARLRAAGRLMPVVAIETSGADATYAWDLISGADGFERVTLFENADAQKQPTAEVVRRVGSALDRIRPQAVVVPGWADAAALGALHWCLQNRIPAVIMSESTAWDEPRKAWKEFIKRQIVGLGSAALAGGRPHRDYLAQLGMPPDRVFLGYDAVDNEYFWEKAETLKSETLKSETRKAESGKQKAGNLETENQNKFQLSQSQLSTLPDDKFQLSGFNISAFQSAPYFLASNRFIEKKNLPRLIEAYALYRKKAETLKTQNLKQEISGCQNVSVSDFTSWDLVLLGDGTLRPTLNSQLATLNLEAHVQMPGFKQYPELPAYYAHAGAFIHASTTEQWGLVVNEAMASGLPVLVSNRCGCAADLVQDGVNGFTFDPHDVEQLAQLMFRISAFNFPLSQFGAESTRIIANWGPERFAQGLKDAAECALRVGPMKASLLQRAILQGLLKR